MDIMSEAQLARPPEAWSSKSSYNDISVYKVSRVCTAIWIYGSVPV